jgi:3-hydroxypropanoate dehydrogenase
MLDQNALDTLFTNARSHNGWWAKNVSDAQIQQIYELMKFGPTAANNCPARLTFITSEAAKKRLKSHLDEGNIDKTISAPVVAIISYDTEFYEKLGFLFPHIDAKSWYVGNDEKINTAGAMNATLQGAYFMLAARSIGLDIAPMGGFNNATLDADFFPNGKTKSIFICAFGHGDNSKLHPRSPRLGFAEACEII